MAVPSSPKNTRKYSFSFRCIVGSVRFSCARFRSVVYECGSNSNMRTVTLKQKHKSKQNTNMSTYFNGKMFCFCLYCAINGRMRQRQMLFYGWKHGPNTVEKKEREQKKKLNIVLLLSFCVHGIGGIIIINHSESVSLFELANRFCINASARERETHKMEINC